jgi:hypothetical protein
MIRTTLESAAFGTLGLIIPIAVEIYLSWQPQEFQLAHFFWTGLFLWLMPSISCWAYSIFVLAGQRAYWVIGALFSTGLATFLFAAWQMFSFVVASIG